MSEEKETESIESLHERIKILEADRKWNKSWVRLITVALFMYAVLVIYKLIVDTFFDGFFTNVFLLAAVPVIAFIVSFRSLGLVRYLIIKHKNKKKARAGE